MCEILGALGLVLPGIFCIRRELTPLAAVGLVIIMTGATTTAARGDIAGAVMPLVLGVVAPYVARGRWYVAVRPSTRRRAVLQTASH